MSEDVSLPFGGSGTVTAHCREDERFRAVLFPEIHDRSHDGGDVCDSPAAYTDSYACALRHSRYEVRACQLVPNVPGDILYRAIWKLLFSRSKTRQKHAYSLLRQMFYDGS